MNSEIRKKVNTVGKVGHILAVIAKIFLIAGMVCMVLGIAVGVIFPRDAVQADLSGEVTVHVSEKLYKGRFPVIGDLGDPEDWNIQLGGEEFDDVRIEKTDGGIDITGSMRGAVLVLGTLFKGCVLGLVYMTAVLVVFCFLDALMKEFRTCETPFAPGVVRKMSNFAWSLRPLGRLSGFSGGEVLPVRFFSVNTFSVNGIGSEFTINISVVLMILVVFALVQVFKYGAELQQHADETL